tara:strand:- start:22 stop:594 length:573 start_codon:yes stop_codon:yes gene_type:complete
MSANEEVEPESEDEEVELKVPVKEAPEKPVKAKRVMTPEMLEKLANARKKAFEVKTANAKVRADNKKVLVKQITEEQEAATKEKIKKSIKPKPILKEVVEEEEDEPPVVKKSVKKKKKKPTIVIEESGSSSDEDTNSNVIFIKRRSSKKPPKEQPVAAPAAPPQPPPVVRQEISAFDKQQMLQRAALRMF